MQYQNQKLILLGCGGHARSVASVAITLKYKDIIFIDDNARDNEMIWNFHVKKNIEEYLYLSENYVYMPCSGDNFIRAKQYQYLLENNLNITQIISPYARIANHAVINKACFIAHNAYIGPDVVIKENTIINTAAIIEHECKVGSHSHVSINTAIAGRCNIGNYVFLGASSTVIDRLSICDEVTLGANSTATKSINIAGTYVGSPCYIKN